MASAYRTIRAAAAALTLSAIVAAPAAAHPFGPPPTAVIRVDGNALAVHWQAAPDDMLAIGERLGLLPAGTGAAYREAQTQVAPPASAEAALDRSPELRAYLLRRIQVSQNGRACPATVLPVSGFVGSGATTVHQCPRPIGEVELTITMLHDIHEAYRTFAVSEEPGAAPKQSVHTVARPRARWDLSGEADPGAQPDSAGGLGPGEPRFLRLIDLPAPTPWVVVTALLLAAGIGAVHALAPGHGKALGAAYLAGSRGRPRDAVLLGVAVAAMHTASVLALGLSLHTLTLGGRALDQVGPWLTVASSLLVLAVGVGSLVRVARRRADGTHAHGHAHDHLPPGVTPLSRRGLVLIAVSGGLLPSPSAFLVLTTALFTGRTLFGLALVAAFSIGLAATLSALGLAVLHGHAVARRGAATRPRLSAALLALPMVSAALITIGGLWLTVFAVRALP